MPDTFTLDSGDTKQVQMMQHFTQMGYYENDAWQVAALPYSGGTYSFFVLLPKAKLTTAQVVDGLSEDLLRKAFENTANARVNLQLPRFSTRQSQELTKSLIALGLSEIFSPRADFSGITALAVKIEAVVHESLVVVDENGTEAAAATAVVFAKGAAPFGQEELKELFANHPFAFAIVHNATNAPLFLGVVGDPQ
jgi:serpin B